MFSAYVTCYKHLYSSGTKTMRLNTLNANFLLCKRKLTLYVPKHMAQRLHCHKTMAAYLRVADK